MQKNRKVIRAELHELSRTVEQQSSAKQSRTEKGIVEQTKRQVVRHRRERQRRQSHVLRQTMGDIQASRAGCAALILCKSRRDISRHKILSKSRPSIFFCFNHNFKEKCQQQVLVAIVWLCNTSYCTFRKCKITKQIFLLCYIHWHPTVLVCVFLMRSQDPKFLIAPIAREP